MIKDSNKKFCRICKKDDHNKKTCPIKRKNRIDKPNREAIKSWTEIINESYNLNLNYKNKLALKAFNKLYKDPTNTSFKNKDGSWNNNPDTSDIENIAKKIEELINKKTKPKKPTVNIGGQILEVFTNKLMEEKKSYDNIKWDNLEDSEIAKLYI